MTVAHNPTTLTVLMSTGGDGEADEPVAVYADPEQAAEDAADFNRKFVSGMWETAYQYTSEVAFIDHRADQAHDNRK